MPLLLAAEFPEVLFVLAIALVALNLLWLARGPIVNALSSLPVIGGELARAFGGALDTARTAANNFLADSVGPLVQAMFAPVNAMVLWLEDLILYLSAVQSLLGSLATAAGGGSGSALGQLQDIITQVAANVLSIAHLVTDFSGLSQLLTRTINVTVPNLISAAVATVEAAIVTAIATESRLWHAAIAAVIQSLTAQLVAAQQALNTAIGTVSNQLIHDEQVFGRAIDNAIGTTEAYALGIVTPVIAAVTSIIRVSIPALEREITTVATDTATRIDTLQRDCIDPTCSTLDAGLGLFNVLVQGAEMALLVELISECVHNPQTAGRQIGQGQQALVGVAAPVLSAMGIRV